MTSSSLYYILLASFLVSISSGSEEGMPESHPNWVLMDSEISGTSLADKFVGGKHGELGEFPWIVRVGHRASEEGWSTFTCGGTIITINIVLTAAHCFDSQTPSLIRAGEYDRTEFKDCVGSVCSEVQEFEIEDYAVHEEYESGKILNDLCIVKINGTFEFNDFVRPISLMPSTMLKNNLENEHVEVAGWGIVNITTDAFPPILQKVTLEVVPFEECTKIYDLCHIIDPDVLCAGKTVGFCRGDSGGPLMYTSSKEGSPKTYLAGIVSHGGIACDSGADPSIYVRVSSFVNWILDKLTL